jgi:glycine/D-amino acid oxidase-like deaminating enzyme
MQNPDAIVIGAGIVGASVALSLTNAGFKVRLLIAEQCRAEQQARAKATFLSQIKILVQN